MAKRSKRKRKGRPPRQQGQPKDRTRAEFAAELVRRAQPPRDPAGVLAALQVNPPVVKGHVTEATRRALEQ